MSETVQRFYDSLADSYHQIFPDWDSTMKRQSQIFTNLIAARLGDGKQKVLDCACGIGTQSIGLAAAGHDVVASDISPMAARRAAHEAARRGVALSPVIADMRGLPFDTGRFDVVVCVDNALAHLLTDRDMSAAAAELRRVLRPGGLLVATIRDYRQARRTHPGAGSPQIAGDAATFQLWDWHDDGARYDLRHFQVISTGIHDWRVRVRQATFWAVTPDEVAESLTGAGFTDIAWLEPTESDFYQPVVVATA